MALTNGVSSAIEHCAWGLANPGEGILLGRPYYRAFLPDINMRTGVNVVPVAFDAVDPCGDDCVQAYEAALLQSREQGISVRALMLCHPHNPLGRCYSRETLIALLCLCQKHKIHLISDEIYALSVWENTVDKAGPPSIPFESVLSIDLTDVIDPSLVHVIWGMSKDFGANGIRVGAVISPSNPAFIQSCRACSIYSSPSSLAERAVTEILSDSVFTEHYIKTNKERLSNAYAHAVGELKKHGIEHMPGANAAFFVWIDLGKMYRENRSASSGGAEQDHGAGITQKVRQELIDKKVYLVDGDAAGAETAGWFRLVFTQPPHLVSEAVQRIAIALRA
ncbi:hypothetical protein N0V94_007188 [Neodidymelliopsis sp. IMI 364377]|nr:hypothetical protein N0V94_007188 [Neodidymelliopsis sp. IMI 364377]